MAALDVSLSLSLDPLLLSNHWAWFIALCVATIATFSRLSLLAFLTDSKPLGRVIPSRQVKPQAQEVSQEKMPSEAEQVGKKLYEATRRRKRKEEGNEENLCCAMHWRTGEPLLREEFAEEADEEEAEEENRGSNLCRTEEENRGSLCRRREAGEDQEQNRGSFLRSRTGGEDDEGDVGENKPPLWIYSLLEASRAPSQTPACALYASSVCTHSTFTRSWSQALETHISARISKPWDILQASLPPLVHPSPYLYSLDILRNLPCPQRHISAIKMGSPDYASAHVGFCSGEICLWDIERGMCTHHTGSRISPISGLCMLAHCNDPMTSIAVRPHHTNKQSSVVSLWDDRGALCSTEYVVDTPTFEAAALTCRMFNIGIAGEGWCVSMHDTRMLRAKPFCIYTTPFVINIDMEGQRSKTKVSVCHSAECESKHSYSQGDEAEECALMDTTPPPSTNNSHVDEHPDVGCVKGKRRCSFLTDCLDFMWLLDKKPQSF